MTKVVQTTLANRPQQPVDNAVPKVTLAFGTSFHKQRQAWMQFDQYNQKNFYKDQMCPENNDNTFVRLERAPEPEVA